MSSLVRYENRWNPFQEMEDLHSRLSSIIGRTFGRMPVRGEGDASEAVSLSMWAPLVDIVEDSKEFLIKAELPEVKKEDLRVNVENGVLTLSGERRFEKEEKDRKYHRVERAYGSFSRSFTLPDDADPDKVNAEFRDGILRVHVAKHEKAKPKAIEVKIG